MNKRNYQKELEERITYHSSLGEVPTLLLHSCCAPCSSYVLEYLSKYFLITVFFVNQLPYLQFVNHMFFTKCAKTFNQAKIEKCL